MEIKAEEGILAASLLGDTSNYDSFANPYDWVKVDDDVEDEVVEIPVEIPLTRHMGVLVRRQLRMHGLHDLYHDAVSPLDSLVYRFDVAAVRPIKGLVSRVEPISIATHVFCEAVKEDAYFLVNKRIADLVFEYIIDEERVHSIEPLLEDDIKELASNNNEKVVEEIREEISDFLTNLIINSASESELLSGTRKVIINGANKIATDFGNAILNEYRVKPSDLGEYINLLSNDIRSYAQKHCLGGEWGSLEIDVATNEVVIFVPDNENIREESISRIEVISSDELP